METAMPGIGNARGALIWELGMETAMPDRGIARDTLIWESGIETALPAIAHATVTFRKVFKFICIGCHDPPP